MENYFTLEEAAEYLKVSIDTLKRYIEKGLLPSYKLERAIRFRRLDLDSLLSRNLEKLLIPGLRAVVTHSTKAESWIPSWRITVSFQDTSDKRRILPFGNNFLEYYIYVTKHYLETKTNIDGSMIGAEKFALQHIETRFNQAKNENGDRSIELIKECSIVCAMGKCTIDSNRIPHRFQHKGYIIEMASEGFFPLIEYGVFGKAIVFNVHSHNSHTYFGFGRAAMDDMAEKVDEEEMIVAALETINRQIDNEVIQNHTISLYEYKFHQYIDTDNHGWWDRIANNFPFR